MRNQTLRIRIVVMLLAWPLPQSQVVAQNGAIQLTLKGGWASASEPVRKVQVVGPHAYLLVGETALQVLDVSSRTNPVPLGHYNASQRINGFHVDGNYAFLAEGSFITGTNDPGIMEILDVSQPTNLVHLGAINTLGRANAVHVTEDYAYVAESTRWTGSDLLGALEIFRITNHASPTWLGRYETSNAVNDVRVAGHYAYLAGGDADLTVLDVSNPDTIAWVADRTWTGQDPIFGESGGPAYQITLSSNHVYVADGFDGLHVLDVSDPHQPIQIFSRYFFGELFSVHLSDRYVALRTIVPGETGSSLLLWFLDFRNLSSPVVLGICDEDEVLRLYDIEIVGNCAYFATGDAGFVVTEITEFPFFTSIQRLRATVSLTWNDHLPGLKLQSTPSLTNPDWIDVPGSVGTNRMQLPLGGGHQFFRLIHHQPAR